jgi:hypothetical protein
VLRRFSESANTAGAIVPNTVSLMRQSLIAPPAGVVTRAPSPAAAPGLTAPAATPAAQQAAQRPSVSTPAASGAQAVPAVPASALPENSVIRRFFDAKTPGPVIGQHRQPQIGQHRQPQIGQHRQPAAALPQPDVVDADPSPEQSRSISTELSSREWAELVDIVTRRIESRVTAELSRRGRRNLPRPM